MVEIVPVLTKINELIFLISSSAQKDLIYKKWRELFAELIRLASDLPENEPHILQIYNLFDIELNPLLKQNGNFYSAIDQYYDLTLKKLKELETLIKNLAKIKITKIERKKDLEIWAPNLNIIMPILPSDIPDFKAWINWSGFEGYSKNHVAFDFGAFINANGNCVLGLPEKTPIRAVADGTIAQISCGLAGRGVRYACFINIEHGEDGSGMFSGYHHVVPLVKAGIKVKKGDVIANLYKDPGNEIGKLVHLHFELTNGWNVKNRKVNPAIIFPILNKYRAIPQGEENFIIEGLSKQPKILISNFKKLLLGNN